MNYLDAKSVIKYSRPRFSITSLIIEAIVMVSIAGVITLLFD